MTIEKNVNGEKLEIKLVGRLDTTTAPGLEAELKRSVNGVTKLVFDFSALEYLSSAGLRVLLAAQGDEQAGRDDNQKCKRDDCRDIRSDRLL